MGSSSSDDPAFVTHATCMRSALAEQLAAGSELEDPPSVELQWSL